MPALVVLHAFPLDRSMWDREVRALADAASPIVAPSFPGFGRSELPKRQPTLDDYADAVIGVMDAARIDRAAIAGCSMGGYVAFALWRRHRARISGLALIDTKAEADTPEAAENRVRLARTIREHGVEALLKTPPKWLRDGSPRWPELVELIRKQDKEAVAQASVAMAGRPDSTPDLATIDVPTAVIVGEADAITPLAQSRAMAEAIPHATLAVLPDAGHLSNLEAPEAFDRAIRAWLARLT
jgi:pimeloyl-ACP methyl ester carboxylesterase